MNYIIDGHNLIAKIPGLDLSMPDDEERLIGLLNRYGEHQRGKPRLGRAGRLEVYFDGSPAGQAGVKIYGRVRAHFVALGVTADEAIREQLRKLGKSAKGWTVVTSDRAVQAAAREAHSEVMKAEKFAQVLLEAHQSSHPGTEPTRDYPLSPAEVDEWLAIFKRRKPPQ